MSSIVVKAYWKKSKAERAEEGEEIRRFSVDQDVLTNYGYLTEKIRLAFPSLRNREFTLFWKGITIAKLSFIPLPGLSFYSFSLSFYDSFLPFVSYINQSNAIQSIHPFILPSNYK